MTLSAWITNEQRKLITDQSEDFDQPEPKTMPPDKEANEAIESVKKEVIFLLTGYDSIDNAPEHIVRLVHSHLDSSGVIQKIRSLGRAK